MTKMAASSSNGNAFIVGPDDRILITGASGFIGRRLIANLLGRGFRRLRCFVRPSSDLNGTVMSPPSRSWTGRGSVDVVEGNLLSRADCVEASRGVSVVFHLAAGRGEKSFPDAFANSVVTTRNLLEACVQHGSVKRFVNVSSFAVYTNRQKTAGRVLDETCPIESRPGRRGDPYSFAKVKQEGIVAEYARRFGVQHVTVRPGYVYGPGKHAISGRVGIGTFGLFLHLGGSNRIPLTYIDNCADAIALAGLRPGVDGRVFNVVDDDLPSSREFLRQYKRQVRQFRSIYVPHVASYALCFLWERYSAWSRGQLEPIFNRNVWHAYWKKTRYSNERLKRELGWAPTVSVAEGVRRSFETWREDARHA
jgi:nucleoside-diphosphate-sugar epimerase